MQFVEARRRACRPLPLLAAICFPLSLAAQPARTLEPVVVSGARVEQRLDETLAPVTLITRDDIERAQATDLVELIGRQPGFQFVRSGGFGAQASVFARGAGSSQLLVLVDGVRLNSVNVGAATLGGIGLETIERIEIVRGNLSSLYGSEAIGGVVQVFTRAGDAAREAVATVEGGSGSTRAGSLSASGSFGATQLSATAAARRAAPFSAIDPVRAAGANPDVDANRHRSGALRLSSEVGAATQIRLAAWTRRNETDFDDAFDGPSTRHREDARTEAWQAGLRRQLDDAWSLDALAGEVDEQSENRTDNPASFNNGRFETRNRQGQIVLRARLAERVDAQLGAEHLGQRGASTAYDASFTGLLTRFRRHVASGWAGLTGRSTGEGRQQVQLNVRHDDYSDVGAKATWLAAYGYALTPALRATLQASTAFRAPSFNDLHFPFFGNPDLRPERARSAEAGLRYAAGGLRASLAAFRTRTRDLIQFDPASSRAENIARTRVQGVELSAGALHRAWQVNATATWLDTEDEATGERLVRRAPRMLSLGVFHDAGALRVGAEAFHVAARDDFDINTFARRELPAHTLLRALAEWRTTRHLKLKLRVENLTDEQYTLIDGYRAFGRSVFGGVEWRL